MNIIIIDDFKKLLKTTDNDVTTLTHGDLVESHIEKMLPYNSSINIIRLEISDVNSRTLTTNDLGKNLNKSLSKGQRYIINMSFAITDCGVLDDYRSWQNQDRASHRTFSQYAIEVHQSVQRLGLSIADVLALLLTPSGVDYNSLNYRGKDALLSLLNGKNPDLFFVAAAGNYGLPYPLYPAAFANVLGVASTDVNDQPSKGPVGTGGASILWTNSGDVSTRGQWFETGLDGQKVYYAGTSFAAPTASALLAHCLLEGQTVGPFPDGWLGRWQLNSKSFANWLESHCR